MGLRLAALWAAGAPLQPLVHDDDAHWFINIFDEHNAVQKRAEIMIC